MAVTDLRAHLSEYLDHARRGEEVIVTERGVPIARLTSMEHDALFDRLVREGVVSLPSSPTRTDPFVHRRPRPRGGSVSDLVSEQRD